MCRSNLPADRRLKRQRQIAYLLFGGGFATFGEFAEIFPKRGGDYSADAFAGVSAGVSAGAMTDLAIRCAVALSGPGAGTKTASR